MAHASASYHLRRLASVGLIEPAVATLRVPRRNGRPKQLSRMSTDAFRGLGPQTARILDRALLATTLALRTKGVAYMGSTSCREDRHGWRAPAERCDPPPTSAGE